MGFNELESVRSLTNNTYQKLIDESETPDDANGFRSELRGFNAEIDQIIAKKCIDFISN